MNMEYYGNTADVLTTIEQYNQTEAFDDHSDDDDNQWGDDFSDTDEEILNDAPSNNYQIQPDPNEEEDLYDLPDAENLLSNPPPKVKRNLKPLNEKPACNPKKPAPRPNKRVVANPQLPIIKTQHIEAKEQSIAERQAMFDRNSSVGSGKVPSPFRGSSNTFPQFGNRNNSFTKQPDTYPQADSNNNRNVNKNDSAFYHETDDVLNYEIPDEVSTLHDTSPHRSGSSKGGPPIPPKKPDQPIPVSDFLTRLKTIKKKDIPLNTDEETYEVCDSQVDHLFPISRGRNDSNASQRSNVSIKSNSSWSSNISTSSSSRENSVRKQMEFRPPMENRPLPMPDEQETYEVVDNGIPPSRPAMPLPSEAVQFNSSARLPPKSYKPSRHIPQHSPQAVEDLDYQYTDEMLSPTISDNGQGISLPDEDEYEMPDPTFSKDTRSGSLVYIEPIAATGSENDSPPEIPKRLDDPKRVTPPAPPSKGSKCGDKKAPSIDRLRMTKPRHSDTGLDQNSRKRFQEKNRTESEPGVANNAIVNVKRPVPIPPVGQKPLPFRASSLDRHNENQESPMLPQKQSVSTSYNPTLPQKPNSSSPYNPSPPQKPNVPIPIKPSIAATRKPQAQSPTRNRKGMSLPSERLPVQVPLGPRLSHDSPIRAVNQDSLQNHSWYHKNKNRKQAEQILLQKGQEGGFIIRDTDKGEGYSISIYHAGAVTHLRVPLRKGQYFLGTSTQSFPSVHALIGFYKSNKILLTSGGEVLLKS